MQAEAGDFDAIAAAYRLLGVPPESSPLHIRRAYRELTRTWHPDKFPPGSHHHEYAAERMHDLKEAFDVIRHAPLRYQFATIRAEDSTPERTARRQQQITARLEYTVRIVAGVLFGGMLSVSLILHGFPVRVALAGPVVTAAAAAIYGDAFWRWVLKLWGSNVTP